MAATMREQEQEQQQLQDVSFESTEDDMESLLPSSNGGSTSLELTTTTTTNNNQRNSTAITVPQSHEVTRYRRPKKYLGGLLTPQPVGNVQILFPNYYFRANQRDPTNNQLSTVSSWGVMGPHWYGPFCIWLLLVVATHQCLSRAHHMGGTLSVWMCYAFLTMCTYLLTDCSFRDPGLVLKPPDCPDGQEQQPPGPDWRWCDLCQLYQPPDGAHCPDCNVCVAGYDHHCVWMGTCIGKKNHKQFVRFNVWWLYYLSFAVVWLVTFGPLIYKKD